MSPEEVIRIHREVTGACDGAARRFVGEVLVAIAVAGSLVCLVFGMTLTERSRTPEDRADRSAAVRSMSGGCAESVYNNPRW